MPRPKYTEGENTARVLGAVAALVLFLTLVVLVVFGVTVRSVLPWFYGVLACLFVIPTVIGNRAARRQKG